MVPVEMRFLVPVYLNLLLYRMLRNLLYGSYRKVIYIFELTFVLYVAQFTIWQLQKGYI